MTRPSQPRDNAPKPITAAQPAAANLGADYLDYLQPIHRDDAPTFAPGNPSPDLSVRRDRGRSGRPDQANPLGRQ